MQKIRKWKWYFIAAIVIIMIFPLTLSAATNTEIIAIMKEVINGVLRAGQDAYCASGVAALCP